MSRLAFTMRWIIYIAIASVARNRYVMSAASHHAQTIASFFRLSISTGGKCHRCSRAKASSHEGTTQRCLRLFSRASMDTRLHLIQSHPQPHERPRRHHRQTSNLPRRRQHRRFNILPPRTQRLSGSPAKHNSHKHLQHQRRLVRAMEQLLPRRHRLPLHP